MDLCSYRILLNSKLLELVIFTDDGNSLKIFFFINPGRLLVPTHLVDWNASHRLL